MSESLDAKVARLEEANRRLEGRIDEQDEIIEKQDKLIRGPDKDCQAGILHDVNKFKAESKFFKAAYFFGGAFGTAVISWVTNYFLPGKPPAG